MDEMTTAALPITEAPATTHPFDVARFHLKMARLALIELDAANRVGLLTEMVLDFHDDMRRDIRIVRDVQASIGNLVKSIDIVRLRR